MTLLGLVLQLVVIGVLLWALNAYGAPYIRASILKIINAVVVIAVILYVLSAFGVLDVANIPVPRLR